VVDQGPAGQKDDGQVDAAPAQLGQQIDPRGLRQDPIEDDDVGAGGRLERAQQRGAIGKALDGKSMIRQLGGDRLAAQLVVFDEKHADRIWVGASTKTRCRR
jgi:hypothetical protein